MDVFDRDWCNLFVWTVNGSTLFHIKRDPDYWSLCFQGLAEFWWNHVVPGKHELAAYGPGAEERYRLFSVYLSVNISVNVCLCNLRKATAEYTT